MLLSHTVSLHSQTLRHRRRPIYNRFVWRAVVVVRRDASSRAPGRLRYRCIGNATSPPGGAGVSGRASAPLGVAGHCVALRRLRGHFARPHLLYRAHGGQGSCVPASAVRASRGPEADATQELCRPPVDGRPRRKLSEGRVRGAVRAIPLGTDPNGVLTLLPATPWCKRSLSLPCPPPPPHCPRLEPPPPRPLRCYPHEARAPATHRTPHL